MIFAWLRLLRPRRPRPIRHRPCRPGVEWLEGRVTPAVYRVTGTADLALAAGQVTAAAAPGEFNARTLRAAVAAANATAASDTILVPAGLYRLTVTGPPEDAAASGDLDVTRNLTVVGAGAAATRIDGNLTDRAFTALSGPTPITLTLRNLTIQNGRAQPGDLGLGAEDAAGGGWPPSTPPTS